MLSREFLNDLLDHHRSELARWVAVEVIATQRIEKFTKGGDTNLQILTEAVALYETAKRLADEQEALINQLEEQLERV